MSRTIRGERQHVRDRHAKFEDRYTGHFGEGIRSEEAVRKLKKREHKHNRRVRQRINEGEF